MPSTPFIGVRISWLMLARNSLLARLAASADSFAPSSSRVRSAIVASRFWAWVSSSCQSRALSIVLAHCIRRMETSFCAASGTNACRSARRPTNIPTIRLRVVSACSTKSPLP